MNRLRHELKLALPDVVPGCAQADAAVQLRQVPHVGSRVNVPEMAAVPKFGIDTEALAPMVSWPPWRDRRKDSVTARIPPMDAVPDPDSDTLPEVSNEPFSAAETPIESRPTLNCVFIVAKNVPSTRPMATSASSWKSLTTSPRLLAEKRKSPADAVMEFPLPSWICGSSDRRQASSYQQ